MYTPTFYTNVGFANLNGVKRQLAELGDFMADENIDIMFINETHLRPCDKARLPNYNLVRKDRLHNRGGGTAIYSKKSFKCTEYILPQLNSIEACAVVLEDENFGEVLMISAYNPPNSKLLSSELAALMNSGLPTILAGDLNSKSTHWGCRATNPNGKILQNFILDEGVILAAPDEPTHFPGNLAQRPDILDIMLLKGIPHIPKLKVHSALSSDHSPISFTFYGLTKPPELAKYKTNWDTFHTISGQNITINPNMSTTQQIDEAIETLTQKIKRDIDSSSSPIRTNIEVKLPHNIKQKIKEKNRLRKVYKNTRHPQAKTNWNISCREVSTLIKEYKQSQWEETVMRLSTQDNTVWKMAKALKSKPNMIGPLQGPTSLVYTEKDMAVVLAGSLHNQFSPHATPINLELVDRVNSEVDNYLAIEPSANITHTTPKEVQDIIKTLNPKKAAGYDLISNMAIKNISNKIIVNITNIYNACFRLNYFPHNWKKAIVILFKKPGKSPQQPSNYRPISLLPCLAKLFEKVINIRLQTFLNENNIIHTNQYGFKKGHSTVHQVNRIVEIIGEAFNNRESIGTVFLDVRRLLAAYGTMDSYTNS